METDNALGYAIGPLENLTPDSYYVGEFNKSIYDYITSFIEKDMDEREILLVSGRRGMGKKHLLHATLNRTNFLKDNAKFISGEMLFDLLLKSPSDYMKDMIDMEVCQKTLFPTKFIVIYSIDFMIKILGVSNKNSRIISDFLEVLNSWFKAGVKVIFTVDMYYDELKDIIKESYIGNILSEYVIYDVEIKMPKSKFDKENIINNSLYLNNRVGFNSQKYYEVLAEAISKNIDAQELLEKADGEIHYIRPKEDYTLTQFEMESVINQKYSSIMQMICAALEIVANRSTN